LQHLRAMLADRVLFPVILGNVLGFATIVAWCAVPDAAPAIAAPAATVSAAAPAPAPRHVPTVITAADLIDPDPVDAAHLGFVLDIAGEPYVQLATFDDADQLPRHGRVRRTTSVVQPDQQVVFARIAPRDLPAAWRDWVGREVVVDGHCRARVDSFALRAGRSGDGVDEMAAEAPAKLLAEAAPALVAHLDGCRGGSIARDASLPAPVVATRDTAADDAALIRLATTDLFASELGRHDIALRFAAAQQDGDMDMVTTSTVVVHPVTHVRYVIVHASMTQPTCGGPEGFELTGVYTDDGNGDLDRNWVGDQPLDLSRPLVDLDNDGKLEAVGSRDVTSLLGTTLADRSGDQWIGCPC
jgi:hypothetical protein